MTSRGALAIDLFCGLGGWSEGLLAEGYDVVGFDIERHQYPEMVGQDGATKAPGQDWNNFRKTGTVSPDWKYQGKTVPTGQWQRYPAQLVIQDVLTLHGSQFRNAALIVASPPCQEYSYMAMPWSRAKAIAAEYRSGVRDVADLTRLFDACFRIQREACEAAGRHIPMVVENVRGAQPWVGRAPWNYGSFYLWGDVPALMPHTFKAIKIPGRSMSKDAALKWGTHNMGPGHQIMAELSDAVKQHGSGPIWFDTGIAAHSSKSASRKAASAQIAKIPLDLARHIARCYFPRIEATA